MKINYNHILNLKPFSLKKEEKEKLQLWFQKKLFKHHYKNNIEFRKISNFFFKGKKEYSDLINFPYLHVNLFKKFNLQTEYSDNKFNIYKSSGTSGNNLSKIFLDKKTSILQSIVLKKIFSDLIKSRKDVILFIENENILKNENRFSARGAAINGFSQLVDKHYFILDKNKKLKINFLKKIIKKNKNIIFFGFTSDVWIYLMKELLKKKIKFKKNNGILIHGGGWKKLEYLNIKKNYFNSCAKKILGIDKSVNYYGMIEQTGSIFLECSEGYFHCSIFSDIFIRDKDLKIQSYNIPGLIQTMSIIPLSYPGHNILTEDQGYVVGIDDCKCGKFGKYFALTNRVNNTETRGCSDAYL